MGNSLTVLLCASHDLLHGNGLQPRQGRRLVGLLGLGCSGLPPTFRQAVHNREHLGRTYALDDPERGT